MTTFIHLDNWTRELKPFTYYPDPVFDNLTKNVINEASIIIVTVSLSGRGGFVLFLGVEEMKLVDSLSLVCRHVSECQRPEHDKVQSSGGNA